MNRKATSITEYSPHKTELVKATCLYIATKLGDLSDHITLVGGLVPSLLVPQGRDDEGIQDHAGTMDADVGLSLALITQERYSELSDRLRNAGFSPDKNENGNPTFQRWRVDAGVTVDFLLSPLEASDKGGTLRHLENDLAAVITPGRSLDFEPGLTLGDPHELTPVSHVTGRFVLLCCKSGRLPVVMSRSGQGATPAKAGKNRATG
jgi:hypothetical protein